MQPLGTGEARVLNGSFQPDSAPSASANSHVISAFFLAFAAVDARRACHAAATSWWRMAYLLVTDDASVVALSNVLVKCPLLLAARLSSYQMT